MGRGSDSFDLDRLGLSAGEGRRLDLTVGVDAFELAGQHYVPEAAELRLDVARTTAGYALRIRSEVRLSGPCMRCLEDLGRGIEIDAREVDQPGGGEELESPYVEGGELDLRGWTRDALVLALPAQIVCREECRGLCGLCGENLNDVPEHRHEAERDPRWAALDALRLD